MTDKNLKNKIVDDYYSNKNQDLEKKIEEKDKKTKIIWKIKNKKVVKKVDDTKVEKKPEPQKTKEQEIKEKEELNKEKTTSPKINTKKIKWDSKLDSKTKNKEKIIEKNTTSNTLKQKSKTNNKVNKSKNTNEEKKLVDSWNKVIQKKDNKKYKSKISNKKSSKDSKDFSDRKVKNFKKEKINKFAKKRKDFIEEEIVFTRSNKLKNKDKKVKNIENISQNIVSKKWETVVIPDVLSVKEFCEKIWVPLPKVIAEFMKNGMKVTINQKIDFDTACIISDSFDIKLKKDTSTWLSVQEILSGDLSNLLKEEDSSCLEERPPVVSIMWHVDHWKTSLLDYIRKTKVAEKEAWWITQSIWAYQVEVNNKKITFLDTPWHEAFTVMRARWAKLTDIAILVVAADEWVKPQTIESINHALEAWIEIVVAINKMDKDWANPENVKTQLSSHWLQPEDWGWKVPMIPISAKTWYGIDELLEVLIIVAEMLELKANKNREWVWTVIESHLDLKLWPVSTVLINTWTFKKWDYIVCKWSYWRIKLLKDHLNKNVELWEPWTPLLIVWLDNVVEWWDIVQVVNSAEKARIKALEYKELISSKIANSNSWIDILMSKIKSWKLKQLKIVLKSDTNWSLEAIKSSLLKLSTPETEITIIHSWVWNITESDVLMCQWSSAILIWYNVDVLWNWKKIIEQSKIEFISSKIIYHITERVERIVTWMLDPKEVEVSYGTAVVWWIFYEDKKWFKIIWLKLQDKSKIKPNIQARVIRKGKLIWKWNIENLKIWVEDVKYVEWPAECWIKFLIKEKIEIGDTLELYEIEIKK